MRHEVLFNLITLLVLFNAIASFYHPPLPDSLHFEPYEGFKRHFWNGIGFLSLVAASMLLSRRPMGAYLSSGMAFLSASYWVASMAAHGFEYPTFFSAGGTALFALLLLRAARWLDPEEPTQ